VLRTHWLGRRRHRRLSIKQGELHIAYQRTAGLDVFQRTRRALDRWQRFAVTFSGFDAYAGKAVSVGNLRSCLGIGSRSKTRPQRRPGRIEENRAMKLQAGCALGQGFLTTFKNGAFDTQPIKDELKPP
jgi:hypothetical protein